MTFPKEGRPSKDEPPRTTVRKWLRLKPCDLSLVEAEATRRKIPVGTFLAFAVREWIAGRGRS